MSSGTAGVAGLRVRGKCRCVGAVLTPAESQPRLSGRCPHRRRRAIVRRRRSAIDPRPDSTLLVDMPTS